MVSKRPKSTRTPSMSQSWEFPSCGISGKISGSDFFLVKWGENHFKCKGWVAGKSKHFTDSPHIHNQFSEGQTLHGAGVCTYPRNCTQIQVDRRFPWDLLECVVSLINVQFLVIDELQRDCCPVFLFHPKNCVSAAWYIGPLHSVDSDICVVNVVCK